MPNTHREHPDHEPLRPQALALRHAGLSRRQIRDRLGPLDDAALSRLLEGEPPPEWTKRPNAKDDLRATARELRLAGKTYDEIVADLGVSKSSVSLWVRDLPKPARPPESLHRMREARWAPYREARDRRIERTRAEAAGRIDGLSDRDLLIAGVTLYWAEGTKSKPYARRETVELINSDPAVVQLFLRWLALVDVTPDRLRCRISIHESADLPAAERFWADLVGIPPEALRKPVIKKHNPKTVRRNLGEGYRGCLAIRVLQSAELYRRIEGWWYGIVLGAERPD
jgi:transcriptional regulator with XRE-family HTH domain